MATEREARVCRGGVPGHLGPGCVVTTGSHPLGVGVAQMKQVSFKPWREQEDQGCEG